MVVDGVPNVRTCVTPLKAGMKVETQTGKGTVPLNWRLAAMSEIKKTDILIVGGGPPACQQPQRLLLMVRKLLFWKATFILEDSL
jgi:hypothetical protein